MLKNLRAEMARHGKTIAEMAELLDVSVNTFSFKLHGKREFTLKELKALADYFNVSIDYLAEESDGRRLQK
jgi:transcriptional regulator with XRE-family HTH domain